MSRDLSDLSENQGLHVFAHISDGQFMKYIGSYPYKHSCTSALIVLRTMIIGIEALTVEYILNLKRV